MKRLLITILLCCAIAAQASDWDKGWECGWEAGWKAVRGSYSLPPLAPLSPLPPLGENSWREGFANGVLAGAAAAEGRK